MTICKGCGAVLQNEYPDQAGYTPRLDAEYCRRCFRLIHYDDLTVSMRTGIDSDAVLKEAENTPGAVLWVVDLFDFEAGMIPGLSAHMPELILYSDRNGYDVETYIQIYNCMGFMMQIEIEGVNGVIWNAKKPVMTIKSMAAGRCTPFVGITFSFATIRPQDMVTLGAFTPDEVHEDVEIALAAIERRRPVLGKRSSPARTAIVDARQ